MFFELEYVPTHRLYELQAALECFFQCCTSNTPYNKSCFPKWFETVLDNSWRLRVRFQTIADLIQSQDLETRQHTYDVFINNNRVEDLCDDNALSLELLKDVRKIVDKETISLVTEIKELFDYLYSDVLRRTNLFGGTDDLSIKDHHVQFRRLNSQVCPFCAIRIYPPDGRNNRRGRKFRRSSYDHYLAQVHYPLASVNFRNLMPMCTECNTDHKGTTDILFTSDTRKKRRQNFYPYTKNGGNELSINCVKYPTVGNMEGEWEATITPSDMAESEKVKTWDSVFNILARLEVHVGNFNNSWVNIFLRGLPKTHYSVATLRGECIKEAEKHASTRHTLPESILKESFFRYMAQSAPEAEMASYCNLIATTYKVACTVSVEELGRP